jgi:poly(3-hydroxyalkanoate) synthetase
MYLDNKLREPGALTMAGAAIDLSRITIPVKTRSRPRTKKAAALEAAAFSETLFGQATVWFMMRFDGVAS